MEKASRDGSPDQEKVIYYNVGDPEKLNSPKLVRSGQPDKATKRVSYAPKRPPPSKPTSSPNRPIRKTSNPAAEDESTSQTEKGKSDKKPAKPRPPMQSAPRKNANVQTLEIKSVLQDNSTLKNLENPAAKIPFNTGISQPGAAVVKHADINSANQELRDCKTKPICPARPPPRTSKVTKIQTHQKKESTHEILSKCPKTLPQDTSNGEPWEIVLKEDSARFKLAPQVSTNSNSSDIVNKKVTGTPNPKPRMNVPHDNTSEDVIKPPSKTSNLSSPDASNPIASPVARSIQSLPSPKTQMMTTKDTLQGTGSLPSICFAGTKRAPRPLSPRNQPSRPDSLPPPHPYQVKPADKDQISSYKVHKSFPPRRPPPPPPDKIRAVEDRRRNQGEQVADEVDCIDALLKHQETSNNDIDKDNNEDVDEDDLQASKEDRQAQPRTPTPAARPKPAKRTTLYIGAVPNVPGGQTTMNQRENQSKHVPTIAQENLEVEEEENVCKDIEDI